MADFDMDHQLEKAFRNIDKNGDGFLTQDEISECLEMFGFKKNQSEYFMTLYDTNNDGKISLDEFIKTTKRRVSDRDTTCALLRNTFRTIDQDHSGKITASELHKFFNSSMGIVVPTTVEQWIEDHDKDGDNALSFEEFLDFAYEYL
ncbi:CaM3 [Fasciola gigantica]|uniref:CaM3 n=1 Tax=Fasciola gigantica TaxID=46835 RepID=A0A504YSA3_FASGI|nr:CaM3 [Fasciola gigantica]